MMNSSTRHSILIMTPPSEEIGSFAGQSHTRALRVTLNQTHPLEVAPILQGQMRHHRAIQHVAWIVTLADHHVILHRDSFRFDDTDLECLGREKTLNDSHHTPSFKRREKYTSHSREAIPAKSRGEPSSWSDSSGNMPTKGQVLSQSSSHGPSRRSDSRKRSIAV